MLATAHEMKRWVLGHACREVLVRNKNKHRLTHSMPIASNGGGHHRVPIMSHANDGEEHAESK